MPTKVILIRHGETEFKHKNLLDGQIDTKLNKKGILQAKKLGRYLKNKNFSKIYCSPLQRSKTTAKIINMNLKKKVPIIEIKNFKEIDCGLCNGLSVDLIKRKFPKLIEGWKNNTDPKFPKGENIANLEKRSISSFKKIISENKNRVILIVGHGALNIAIIGYYLKIPYGLRWQIDQFNCCINEMVFDDGSFRINKVNYVLR